MLHITQRTVASRLADATVLSATYGRAWSPAAKRSASAFLPAHTPMRPFAAVPPRPRPKPRPCSGPPQLPPHLRNRTPAEATAALAAAAGTASVAAKWNAVDAPSGSRFWFVPEEVNGLHYGVSQHMLSPLSVSSPCFCSCLFLRCSFVPLFF